MENQASIYSYIKEEESRFNTEEIHVFENWKWNFKNHVQMSLSLKHGKFVQGENNWLRPFKKVIAPILNLRYRAEDIELKNINLYVENDTHQVATFLLKKYHDEVYVKEHDLDSFFDEMGIENIDLGGVLVQKGKDVPEVMPLQFIAFCDQTDIMGGPIGFKYYFSPSKFRKMADVGWGDEKNGANITLDELIVLAQFEKEPLGRTGQKKNKTTGKNIEVYIVRGNLPEAYLKDNDNMDDFYEQLHIVAFYKNDKEKNIGVTLYRKKADEEDLMFFTSDKIRGRALGSGGAEELFNEQIWTNFLEIHKTNLLEAASKVPLYTDDDGFANRNKIQDMENLEITTIAEGKRIGQIPTAAPGNIALFEREINDWYRNAQLVGVATDPLLGQHSPGMTYRGQQGLIQQGLEQHEYRRGKFAKFIEKIYRTWIIPELKKEILKGRKFLANLSSDEFQWVTDRLAENYANYTRNEQVLNGELPEDKDMLVQKFKEDYSKKGNKQKLEILKGEFKDAEIKLDIDVAGKQKNLGEYHDKLLSIFQLAFANPQGFQQVLQIPGMGKTFSDVLEVMGISPVDFNQLTNTSLPQISPQPQANPMQPPQTIPQVAKQ